MQREKIDLFISRKDEILLWYFLFFFILMTHLIVLTRPSARDDLSVLRASAFVAHFPNDLLLEKIENDLINHASSLSEYEYNQFRLRQKFFGNYIATDTIIFFLERFPILNVFQTALVTSLGLHLFFVGLFFFLLRLQFGSDYKIFLVAALVSVFPRFIGAFRIYLFGLREDTWLHTLPRTAMAFVILIALLILSNQIFRNASWQRKFIYAGLLFVIAILLHASMAMLFIGICIFFWIAFKILHTTPVEWAAKKGIWLSILLYILAILGVAGVEFTIYLRNEIPFVKINGIAVSWIAAVSLISYLWMSVCSTISENKPHLRSIGDIFFNALLSLSILVFGLHLFKYEIDTIRFSNDLVFYISEASNRLSMGVHLFFWLVAGLVAYALIIKNSHRPSNGQLGGLASFVFLPLLFTPSLTNFVIVFLIILLLYYFHRAPIKNKGAVIYVGVVSVLAAISISSIYTFYHEFVFNREVLHILDCDLFHVNISNQMEALGREIYFDKIAYYQSIANEMRKIHLPEAQIIATQSCEMIYKVRYFFYLSSIIPILLFAITSGVIAYTVLRRNIYVGPD